MQLEDLQTPCLILDRAVLERNLKRMSASMRKHGVSLRPHLKTAKSAEVATLATAGEAGGITVSTLAEAEYFADHGFRDILVANALPPTKLDRAAAMIEGGVALTLVTDDVTTATAIVRHRGAFQVLVEVDSGDRRAGVDANGVDLLEAAQALRGKLAGVMTHAGHSYGCRSIQCIKDIAEEERATIVTAAARLRDAGMRCEVVSVGSTPTMTHADRLDGVTEARPGVYMFQDLFQAEIGSCRREDIAVTVLASVIGRKPDENRILLDAGALALSKDRSTQTTANDSGFGQVWNLEGKPAYGDCIVERVYQEHGVAVTESKELFDRLPIGAKVRIAPNHACITAAGHAGYHVVDGSTEVVAEWGRVNGW